MFELFIVLASISGTIVGGMLVHGLTDRGYHGQLSTLDRLIEAWSEDREAQRKAARDAKKLEQEVEKSKLKFLAEHMED